MITRPTLRLPAGMRDFAPEAAAARRRIAETLLQVFDRWGFSRVITPAFEYEDVLALGLGSAGRAAAIRFVEPSSGQVVALPPDITPQIARLIATRFHDEPGPLRLSYEGTVVRLDQRARSQREIIQAGVEMAGVAGPEGDAEVIALGAAALQSVGFTEVTIDIGHLGLCREVLSALPLGGTDDGDGEAARDAVRARIAKRDKAGLRQLLAAAGRGRAARDVVEFACALPDLAGPPSVLRRALDMAPRNPAGIRQSLRELGALLAEVERRRIPARLHVDLSEVRGFDYYTGMRVQGYVPGAALPLLQGGRYDGLLARYGRSSPAVGFAIDVEATAVALEQTAASGGAHPATSVSSGNGVRDGGVLVAGPAAAALELVEKLRASGRRAAVAYFDDGRPAAEVEAYSRRWHFAEVRHLAARARAARAERPARQPRNKQRG